MKTKTSILSALAVGLLTPVAPFANEVHPIVDFQAGYLLGSSSTNQKWLTTTSLAKSKMLPTQKKYRLYSMTGFIGEITGAKAVSMDAPCPDTMFVEFKPNAESAKYKNGIIAIAGSWNALPRVPRAQSLAVPTYRAVVASLLRAKGIVTPIVRIAQVYRVDLDGDGVDEVLINATNHQGTNGLNGSVSPDSKAGEYSMIVLRKIVKGKVQNTVIAGAFYPKSKTFNAPSVFKIAGAFDVDGDGKLEIVTKGRYYEGDWTTIYTVSGGGKSSAVLKVQEALSEGCGA